MSSQNPVSLYFHIPFCTKKCHYCHFYVLPDKENPKDQLLEGFARELDLWGERLAGKQLVSIYFGGGTPALFGAERISKLLNKIQSVLPFDPQSIEITLEANPDNITLPLMQSYALAGVNRVSIGIQTLDNTLLTTLGRTHNAQSAINAVHLTSLAGISNISIDLMYDIPGQTMLSWQNTLNQVHNLPASHLSLYNLTIEPHTVFFKYRKTLLKQLPDAESSTEMYLGAVETFKTCGFSQYEISAFARRDNYSRHNVGYWTGRPFLGFGPSAFSYWEGRRFRNIAHLNHYSRMLREGIAPVDFEEELPLVQQRRELLAIGLRLIDGVDLALFEQHFGPLDADTHNTLDQLFREDFITRIHDRIALSPRGILFYDTVATEII